MTNVLNAFLLLLFFSWNFKTLFSKPIQNGFPTLPGKCDKFKGLRPNSHFSTQFSSVTSLPCKPLSLTTLSVSWVTAKEPLKISFEERKASRAVHFQFNIVSIEKKEKLVYLGQSSPLEPVRTKFRKGVALNFQETIL